MYQIQYLVQEVVIWRTDSIGGELHKNKNWCRVLIKCCRMTSTCPWTLCLCLVVWIRLYPVLLSSGLCVSFIWPLFVNSLVYFETGIQLKAGVYYSYSVIRNLTLLPRRPLEPSQFSVGMSDTQRNSPPVRSYMLTTNRGNRVENKRPKLFKSYLVFY